MKLSNYYTVETVLSGHPDKVCDQICDAILDEFIHVDKSANVTVECMGTNDTLIIGGEVGSDKTIDIEQTVLNTYTNIGYNTPLNIVNKLHKESNQTNSPLKNNLAGDQGIMYGFACENEYNFLPYGVYLVNAIAKEIDNFRKKTNLYLPDGKVQLTISDSKIETLVVCVQHREHTNMDELKHQILNMLFSSFPELALANKVFFNHNSNFVNGGFSIDAGLSGRKIIADTYCGLVPHGGGSFSGKDPYRMDRSAAYMARFVAKNLVANQLCKHCLVSVAYIFGYEKPVMLSVESDKPALDKKLLQIVQNNFDFTPNGIVERLDLYHTKYLPTSIYGHFTNLDYPWEKIINL